ncbi:GLUG motif-containing protein [Pseudomonas aeruginosa]|uniref:GLUG motif-containing protein n=2 Tax=Pseudomonas aeruginosa TaxID=287 RepID=UPI0010487EC3|nr:GLUG motif-containing protein [Pseudomonas aeruginosa]HCE6896466.1 filamentous hemagglutinin N-terminal domain-containing protein [Pseudomonas aeruginosa]HCE6903084.1 filamentous hemagglutinin N-terminal domain-containing protein [Pseudomonas aeruginosa]HCE7020358.1 filamentous hemagglutinin N-terminal domain-containing protein [Pseudomonas aeruginosa]HCE7064277.1 filamentous hemagglutinin N-terminal domain-containing protein [Pseudomonas aeruginosa]HCE7347364.1 filamentous hemagglutinin N-
MNRSYALVWNQATGCWNVASEGTRRRGKSGRGTLLAVAGASLLNLLGLPEAFALPSDGKIVNGQGSIHTSVDGKHMTIDQQSQKLIAHWNGFDIAADERVSFQQQNSNAIALNRVLGNDGSKILGKLDANGKVFLVNPNGVMFGKTAQVNVGGLVASTLDISDKDFLDGNYRFSGKSTAQVSNAGSLNASEGGSVALLGARVDNSGVVQARLGSVALGAGEDVSLNFDGNGLLNLQVNAGAVDALVHNGGLLKADGGQVLMTARSADSLLRTVVSNQGVIEAKTLQNRDGRIVLDAGNGTLQVAGRQDASTAGQGNGGLVENRGARVEVQLGAKVDTHADQGRTGTWKVSAERLTVSETAPSSKNRGFNGNSNISGNHGDNNIVPPGGNGMNNAGGTESVVRADTLNSNLDTTNIELSSTQGDLKVNGPLSWNNGNRLGLSAERGNIEVNGSLRATGDNAGLGLSARDHVRLNADLSLTGRNARLELNSGKGHKLKDGARVTLSGQGAGYRANGEDYRVVQNLAQLREIEADMDGRYVLGNQIKGGNTRFRSLGNGKSFNGTFDGLGNSISDLSVYDTSAYVGLFSVNNGIIRNLNLDHVWASGAQSSHYNTQVGTLAGLNNGIISNVKASNIRVTGASHLNSLGGLVALNLGSIDGSSASGQVIGDKNTYAMGGLVAENISDRRVATITNSRADVSLSGRMSDDSSYYGAGGLVGRNTGRIANSQSAGSIQLTGNNLNLGGLVGSNDGGDLINVESSVEIAGQGVGGLYGGLVGLNERGSIIQARARGKVSGNGSDAIGGLVGKNLNSAIIDSSATGDVADLHARYLGGLAGYNQGGALTNASAGGNVNGGDASYAGGLVGYNTNSPLVNVSATGNVSANNAWGVGGLVGWNLNSSIGNALANGKVTGLGSLYVGGLLGYNKGGSHSGLLATGNVSAGPASRVGGLIGGNFDGWLNNASAKGNVIADKAYAVGGLIGLNQGGRLQNLEASGNISGNAQNLGGLIGISSGATITNARASGQVAGGDAAKVGGLIGASDDLAISNARASGKVSGNRNSYVGGLIGVLGRKATVENSSASGDVEANYSAQAAGLVGLNSGTIRTSSASGNVRGAATALGGLVGFNQGWIYSSSASGKIEPELEGQAYGGLIGMNFGKQSQNSVHGDAAKAPLIGRDFGF